MALSIVEGGTTAGVDGTAVSNSGALTQPIIFSALSTTASAFMRCSSSAEYGASGAVTFVCSSGVQVSWDESAWSASATAPLFSYVNKPVYFKQVTVAEASAGTFTTSGSLSATAAVGDVGSFTASAGSASGNVISWAYVANASYYIVEWSTSASASYGNTFTTTASSYTMTGQSSGTAYCYRIKADGSGAYTDSANYATASATTSASASDFWSDTCDTLDTDKWRVITSASGSSAGGTVTASGGSLAILTTSASANIALVHGKLPIKTDSSGQVITEITLQNCSGVAVAHFNLTNASAGASALDVNWTNMCIGVNITASATDGSAQVVCYYWNSSDVRYYNGSGASASAWTTAGSSPHTGTIHLGDTCRFEVEIDPANDRWRLMVGPSGNLWWTMDWVTLSTTRGGTGDWKLAFGDATTSWAMNFCLDDVQYEALSSGWG